jgi:hypothetical protein
MVPKAENFPLSTQKLANSAKHWEVIATDVVEQTSNTLRSNQVLGNRALVITEPPERTAFNAAFRNFVTTHMVQAGIPVSVCQDATLGPRTSPDVEVHHDVQFVRHAEGVRYTPGMWTALALGVVVVRSLAVSSTLSNAEKNLAILGAGAAADGINYFVPPAPSTEIIITTTVTDKNRYVMRRSDIYYVPSQDAELFIKEIRYPSLCQRFRY